MFDGCSSLESAPVLPAKTLAYYCYFYMFKDYTSLTTAPTLPATTLDDYCYYWMFKGCRNLSSIEVNFTAWLSTATSNWVSGVSSTVTFKCPAALPQIWDNSHIPDGWSIV